MGDRGQIFMKNSGVYLYTHYGAGSLIEDVQIALAKKWRWDDEEYLSRIILETLVSAEFGTETGFGIGTKEHHDIWLLITIDCDKQEVSINNKYEPKQNKTYTFTEFCKDKLFMREL